MRLIDNGLQLIRKQNTMRCTKKKREKEDEANCTKNTVMQIFEYLFNKKYLSGKCLFPLCLVGSTNYSL